MKIYDTLIIGCGYTSVGHAVANENSVICEEHQICDTGFYLPQRSFRYKPYTPRTEEGKRLLEIFNSLSLFHEGEQNTSGFECALCSYIEEKRVNVLLKCRVVGVSRTSDGTYDVTVHTNEGLTHVFAKEILNTAVKPKKKKYTVLFVSKDIERDAPSILSAFPEAEIEPAFYRSRYALHLYAEDADENRIKLLVYQKWCTLDTDAKILYMSPVFYGDGCSASLCDWSYGNPIEAFEAGYLWGKEQ